MILKDNMVDLETFGQRPGCVIRSIGAVAFDPSGMGMGFYINIDKQSCLDAGFVIDPQTEAWWAKQSQEAQDSLLTDPRPLNECLAKFASYWKSSGCTRIWSQGANFDSPILDECYNRLGLKTPWIYWNARDTRTAYDLAGFNAKSMPREGTYHNALADAKHQVLCVQAAVKRLKGN